MDVACCWDVTNHGVNNAIAEIRYGTRYGDVLPHIVVVFCLWINLNVNDLINMRRARWLLHSILPLIFGCVEIDVSAFAMLNLHVFDCLDLFNKVNEWHR